MTMTFGNPAGFWALLGIPVILFIHFFHRPSTPIIISTLFLIQITEHESKAGRRFDTLRNSPNLWIQILIVILLTWLLIKPMWLRSDSVQKTLVLLDSSVSMSAFQKEVNIVLGKRLKDVQKTASQNEWILMETNLSKQILYSGSKLSELLMAIRNWKPNLGTHEFSPAFQLARNLVGKNGQIIFISDHQQNLAEDITQISLGSEFDNCGFAGVRVQEKRGVYEWNVFLKSYGKKQETRQWWIEMNGGKTEKSEITLSPGQSILLKGVFPPHIDRLELHVSPDKFNIDDRCPLLKPIAKELNLSKSVTPEFESFLSNFLKILDAFQLVDSAENSDLTLQSVQDSTQIVEDSGILFRYKMEAGRFSFADPIIAEQHTLTEGLYWEGFSTAPLDAFAIDENFDQVLLWQRSQPLIVLRELPEGKQLWLNFDIRSGNASKFPSLILLLHRFVELIRKQKVGVEYKNVELNQRIKIPYSKQDSDAWIVESISPKAQNVKERKLDGPTVRAPSQPGFFKLKSENAVRMKAAAHFADIREANFLKATGFDNLDETLTQLILKNSQTDHNVPIWVLLLGGLLLANWHLSGKYTE